MYRLWVKQGIKLLSIKVLSATQVAPEVDEEELDGDLEELSEESEGTESWVYWFVTLKGNEFFCEVDEDYLLDRFNLAGLNAEVSQYTLAMELITDSLDDELEPQVWDDVERVARHLYGLIHARFVVTAKGLMKMAEKFKRAEFGRCPRVHCHNQAVLPVGLSDVPGNKGVKLYCPRCEDVYSPPTRKHALVDGAYFGTSLPHLVLQSYPSLLPQKTNDRYIPRIFGFKVHEAANEHRKQDMLRESMNNRLRKPREE